MDPDPEILPQSRSLNRLSIRSHVADVSAEDEVDRFTRPGIQDKGAIGRVFRNRARAFHRRGTDAGCGRDCARTGVLRVGDNRQRSANACHKKDCFNHNSSPFTSSKRWTECSRSTYIVTTETGGCNISEHARIIGIAR